MDQTCPSIPLCLDTCEKHPHSREARPHWRKSTRERLSGPERPSILVEATGPGEGGQHARASGSFGKGQRAGQSQRQGQSFVVQMRISRPLDSRASALIKGPYLLGIPEDMEARDGNKRGPHGWPRMHVPQDCTEPRLQVARVQRRPWLGIPAGLCRRALHLPVPLGPLTHRFSTLCVTALLPGSLRGRLLRAELCAGLAGPTFRGQLHWACPQACPQGRPQRP